MEVFTKADLLIMTIAGLGLLINGILSIKNRKSSSKLIKQYFLGLFNESTSEKILIFFIAPFFIFVGFIFLIIGLFSMILD